MILRYLFAALFAGLLYLAGQGSVSMSKPEHEEYTYWAHRRGLVELNFQGEVGFGDIARILMRRRSNGPALADIRDRFTFRTLDMRRFETPDVFRARITDESLQWLNRPERISGAKGRIVNVPVVVENASSAGVSLDLTNLPPQQIPARTAAGYLLNFKDGNPGRLELRAAGKSIVAPIAFETRPLATLRVHLPEPARVYITGSDGLAYVPAGHIPRIIAMSAEYYFHARETFELILPAGPTRIEATRGPEYELASTLVDLDPARPAEVTMRLNRWTDMPARGWYSADSHIHANYVQPHHQNMTPRDMLLIAEAEDLHVPNLLVANSGGAFIHDREHFEGRPNKLSTVRNILYYNEEFRSHSLYGHMSFFGLKSLIEPFFTGFVNSSHPDDYPPNYIAAKEGRQQGAAVVYVHPGMSSGLDQLDWGASAKELPVDAALGVIDAMDVLSNNAEEAGMEVWYRLLNCGMRIGISAGTDSFVNVTEHYTPGGGRVYVHTGGPLRYTEWVSRFREGHSFATNGPMIDLQVDGREPGDEIKLQGPGTVKVNAKISTRVPLDKVDIVVNGVAVLSKRGIDTGEITLRGEVPVESSGWIAARAIGPRHRMVINDTAAFAHTTPVYLTVGGRPAISRVDARFFVAWIDRLHQMVNARGRFSTPERKQEVHSLLDRAAAVYAAQTRD